MSILSQLNSVPMYLICGGIIAFVAVVCVIFLVRAYRAGQALGMDTRKCSVRSSPVRPFPCCPLWGSCWVSSPCREVWEHPGRGFDCP